MATHVTDQTAALIGISHAVQKLVVQLDHMALSVSRANHALGTIDDLGAKIVHRHWVLETIIGHASGRGPGGFVPQVAYSASALPPGAGGKGGDGGGGGSGGGGGGDGPSPGAFSADGARAVAKALFSARKSLEEIAASAGPAAAALAAMAAPAEGLGKVAGKLFSARQSLDEIKASAPAAADGLWDVAGSAEGLGKASSKLYGLGKSASALPGLFDAASPSLARFLEAAADVGGLQTLSKELYKVVRSLEDAPARVDEMAGALRRLGDAVADVDLESFSAASASFSRGRGPNRPPPSPSSSPRRQPPGGGGGVGHDVSTKYDESAVYREPDDLEGVAEAALKEQARQRKEAEGEGGPEVVVRVEHQRQASAAERFRGEAVAQAAAVPAPQRQDSRSFQARQEAALEEWFRASTSRRGGQYTLGMDDSWLTPSGRRAPAKKAAELDAAWFALQDLNYSDPPTREGGVARQRPRPPAPARRSYDPFDEGALQELFNENFDFKFSELGKLQVPPAARAAYAMPTPLALPPASPGALVPLGTPGGALSPVVNPGGLGSAAAPQLDYRPLPGDGPRFGRPRGASLDHDGSPERDWRSGYTGAQREAVNQFHRAVGNEGPSDAGEYFESLSREQVRWAEDELRRSKHAAFSGGGSPASAAGKPPAGSSGGGGDKTPPGKGAPGGGADPGWPKLKATFDYLQGSARKFGDAVDSLSKKTLLYTSTALEAASPDAMSTLSGSWKLLFAQLGTTLVEPSAYLSSKLQQLAHNFEGLNPTVKKVVSGFAVVGAGAALLAAGLRATGLGSAIGWAWKNAPAGAGRLGGIAAAGGAAIGATHYAVNHIVAKAAETEGLMDEAWEARRSKAKTYDQLIQTPGYKKLALAWDEGLQKNTDRKVMVEQADRTVAGQLERTEKLQAELHAMSGHVPDRDMYKGGVAAIAAGVVRGFYNKNVSREALVAKTAEYAEQSNVLQEMHQARTALVTGNVGKFGAAPDKRQTSDRQNREAFQAYNMLLDIQSRTQPAYNSVEDIYKKVQLEALGESPLQQEIRRIQLQQLDALVKSSDYLKTLAGQGFFAGVFSK